MSLLIVAVDLVMALEAHPDKSPAFAIGGVEALVELKDEAEGGEFRQRWCSLVRSLGAPDRLSRSV